MIVDGFMLLKSLENEKDERSDDFFDIRSDFFYVRSGFLIKFFDQLRPRSKFFDHDRACSRP